MWLQFFSQDTHFTVHVFAMLVCLAVSWLYFDAWLGHRNRIGFLRWFGFGMLSLSFLAQSTVVEQSALGALSFSRDITVVVIAVRLFAYTSIIFGQLLDPLQKKPETHGLEFPPEASSASPATAPAILGSLGTSAQWLIPLGGLTIAGLYWRRATKGLERHVQMVAWAFLCISVSDTLHLTVFERSTTNPILYTWVAPFGPLWWLEQVSLIVGILLLGKWVWSYLTERFFSQLFMILVSSTVIVFLVVSVAFTALLLRSSRDDIVANLHTAAQVLDYALSAKQTETLAGAAQLAANTDIHTAIQAKDHKALLALTSSYLSEKGQSSLIITDAYGQVLLRGEDPARWGDSLSGDTFVRRSLIGLSSSGTVTREGVLSPAVYIDSSVPVKDQQGNIIGSVTTGIVLDQAFVDGIKTRTGLDSTIYGGARIVATTLLATDSVSHPIGTIITDHAIQQVLSKGKSYGGDIDIAHHAYIGGLIPLTDADNVPIGMIGVSQPQTSILIASGRSVEITFALTAAMLIVAIIPAYLVTKGLVRQLEH